MKKRNKANSTALIVFILLMLFNANIRTIDLLPDFIAYIIILKLITRVNLRAPYFEEVGEAVKHLLLLSIFKIPAQFLVAFVQSHNVRDNDIVALTTLIFSVLESIFVIKAIKYLFDALFYVGQRTAATDLILPFNITKKKQLTPEFVRALTYFFFIAKNLLVFLPEMLLLTKTVEIGSQTPVFNPATIYSEALSICFITVSAIGIFWLVVVIKYLKHVTKNVNIYEAISSLASGDEYEEIKTKERIRSHSSAMNFIIAASILSIELVFDNFHNINLLPSFIFVSLLVIGNYMLHRKGTVRSLIMGGAFCITSVTSFVLLIKFLENFGYEALISSAEARSDYFVVLIFSAIELLIFTAIMIINSVNTGRYIYSHTGVEPTSEKYMRSDKLYHKSLITKNRTYTFIGVLLGVIKFINVFLKYTVKNLAVEMPDDTTLNTLETALPWFNLVVLGASLLFIAYSFYFFGTLKEEIKLKHNFF